MSKFNILRNCPAVTREAIRQIAMRGAAPFYPLPAGLGKRASLRFSSRGRRLHSHARANSSKKSGDANCARDARARAT
jgi:hypothetical protein